MKTRRILALLLALCLTVSLPVSARAGELTENPVVSAGPADTENQDPAEPPGGSGGTEEPGTPDVPEDPDITEDPADPDGGEEPGTPEDPDAAEGQEDASLSEGDSEETGGGETAPTLPQLENWSFTIDTGTDVFYFEYNTDTMMVNSEAVSPTFVDNVGNTWTAGGVTVRMFNVGDEYPDVVLNGASLSKLHIELRNMPRFAVCLVGDNYINSTATGGEPAVYFTSNTDAEFTIHVEGNTDAGPTGNTLTINSAGQGVQVDCGVLRLDGGVTVNAAYSGTETANRTEEDVWDGDFFNAATQYGGMRIFGDLQVYGAQLNVSAYYLPLDVQGTLDVSGGNSVVTASAGAEQPCRETINAYNLRCTGGARIEALPPAGAQSPAQISVRGPGSVIADNSVVEAQSFSIDTVIREDGTAEQQATLDVVDDGQLIIHPTALRIENGNVIDAPGLSIDNGSMVNVENGIIKANNWEDWTTGGYVDGAIHGILLSNHDNPAALSQLRFGPGAQVNIPLQLPNGQGVYAEGNSQLLLEGGNLTILRRQFENGMGMLLSQSAALQVNSGWVNIWDEDDSGAGSGFGMIIDGAWAQVDGENGGISIDAASNEVLRVHNNGTLTVNAGRLNVNGRCAGNENPGAAAVTGGGQLNVTGGVVDIHGTWRGLVIEGDSQNNVAPGSAAVSGGEVIVSVQNIDFNAVEWGPENALTLSNGVAAYNGAGEMVDVETGGGNPENAYAPVRFYPPYVLLTADPASSTQPGAADWSFTIEAGNDRFECNYRTDTMTVNNDEPTSLSQGTWTGTETGVTVRVGGVGDEYPDMVLDGANLSKLRVHLRNMPRFAVHLEGTSTINYTAGDIDAPEETSNIADRDPAVLFTTDRGAEIAILPGGSDENLIPGTLNINSAGQSLRLDSDGGSLMLNGAVTVNVNYSNRGTIPNLSDYTAGDIWAMDFNATTQFGGMRIFGDLRVYSGAKLNVSAFYLPLDVYGTLEARHGGSVVSAKARTEQPCRETINAYNLVCAEEARIEALPQERAQSVAQISVRGTESRIEHWNSVVEAQSFSVDAEIQCNESGEATGIVPAKLDVVNGGQLIVHPTATGVGPLQDENNQLIEGRYCVMAAPGLSVRCGSTVNVENGGSILANNWMNWTNGQTWQDGCINAIEVWNGERDGLYTAQPTTFRVGPGGWADVSVELPTGQGVQLVNDSQVLLEGGNLDVRLQDPNTWGMSLGKDENSTISPALAVNGGWVNIRDEYAYTTPDDVWQEETPWAGGLAIDYGTVTVNADWASDDPNRPDGPVTSYPGGISIDVAAPRALSIWREGALTLNAGEVNVNGRCEYVYIPGAVEVNGALNMTGGILRADGFRRGMVIEGGGDDPSGMANISGGEIIASVAEGDQAVSWHPGALILANNVAAYDGERNPVSFEQRERNEDEIGAVPLCWYPCSFVRITDHPEYSANDNGLEPEDQWLKLSIFDENSDEWVWECRNGHVADWKGRPMDKNAYGAPPSGVALNWYNDTQEDGTIHSTSDPVLTLTGAALQQIQIEAENVGSVTVRLAGNSTLNDNVRPYAPALILRGGVDYVLNGGGTLAIRTADQAVSADLYGLWEKSGTLTVDGATLDAAYQGNLPTQDMLNEAYYNRSRLGGMLVWGGELKVTNGGKITASAYGTPLIAEDCAVTGSSSALDVRMLHAADLYEPDFFALDVCKLEVLDGAAVTVDAFTDLSVNSAAPVSVLIRGQGSRVEGGTLTAETLHIHGLEVETASGERAGEPGCLTVGTDGQVSLKPVLLRRTGENGEAFWEGVHGVMLFEGSTLAIAGGTVTLTEDPVSGTGESYNAGIKAEMPGCAIDVSGGALKISMSGATYSNGVRLNPGSFLHQTGGEISITSNGPGVEMEGSTVSLTGGTLTAAVNGTESAFVLREGRVNEDGQSVGSELEIGGDANVALKTGEGTVNAAPALQVGDDGAASILIVQGGTLTAEGGQGIFVAFNSQAWFQGGTTTAKGRFRTKLEHPEQLNEQSPFDWDDSGTWVGDAICGEGEIHLGAGVFAKDGHGISAQLEGGYGWNFFAPVYLDAEYTQDTEGYNCGTMTTILSAKAGKAPYSEALEITSGPVTAGVPFTVRGIYTGVENGSVTFKLPEGVTYTTGSLTVNAKPAQPAQNGDGSLTVSLADGGTVRFTAVASLTGEQAITTSAAGASEGKLSFQVDPLRLELPSATSRRSVTVSGVAAEGTMVLYEVSGTEEQELVSVEVTSLGSWRAAISLPESGEDQDFRIQGKLVSGGQTTATEIYTLRYRPNNVDIKTLTITNEIHGSVPGENVTNRVVIDYENNTRTPSYLTYWPELPYLHFEAQFTDNGKVESACVVATDRRGQEVRVPLIKEGGKWVEDPVWGGFYPDNQFFPERYRVEWVPKDTAGTPAPDTPREEPDGMLVELEQGQRYTIQAYSGQYTLVNESGETVTDYSRPGLYTVTTTAGFKQPVYRGNKLFLLVKASGGKRSVEYRSNVIRGTVNTGKNGVYVTDEEAKVVASGTARDAGLEEIFERLVINAGIVEPGGYESEEVRALEEEMRAAFLDSDMYQSVLYAMEASAEEAGVSLFEAPQVDASVDVNVTTDGVNPTVTLSVSISAEAQAGEFTLSFKAETENENTLSFDVNLTEGKLHSLYFADTTTDTVDIQFNASKGGDSSDESSMTEKLKQFFTEAENERTLEKLPNSQPGDKKDVGKSIRIPTTVPGLFVYLEVTPILNFDWNGEIASNFHAVRSYKTGLRWSESGGMETFRSNDANPTVDVNGVLHAMVTAKAGAELSIGLSAYTCLNAGAYANAALVAKAEGHGHFSAGDTGGARAEYFAGLGVEVNAGVKCSLTLGPVKLLEKNKDLLTYQKELWSAGSKVMPTRFSVVEGREEGYISVFKTDTYLRSSNLIDLELTCTDFTSSSVFDAEYTQEVSRRFDDKCYTFALEGGAPAFVTLSDDHLVVDPPEDITEFSFKIKVTYTGSDDSYTIYKIVPFRYETGKVAIIKRLETPPGKPEGSKVATFSITDSNGNSLEPVTTNTGGYAEFTAVAGETYTVTETSCDAKYKPVNPIQTIEVSGDGHNRLVFVNRMEDDQDDPTVVGPNVPTPVSRDPSGYVYEGIPSNRLSGVTVTVYRSDANDKPTANATEGMKWDAAAFDQENPLTTDSLGQYQWMVPDGWWQVKYEKSGYTTVWSDWLPVPPVQTEVNVAMTPANPQPAQLVSATLENKLLTLVFDRPVSAGESNGVTVSAGDKPLDGTLLPVDAEKAPGTAQLNDGTAGEGYYATVFRYALKEAPPEGGTLTVASTLATCDGKTGTASKEVQVPGSAKRVYDLTCQREGTSSAVVTANVETDLTVMLAAAVYDSEGRQLAIQLMNRATGAYTYVCKLSLPAGAAFVRAFVLNENGHAPFGAAQEWNLGELSRSSVRRSEGR